MMKQSTHDNLPKHYALLLICAFLPQLVEGNDLLKLALKVIVMLAFCVLILAGRLSKITLSAACLIIVLVLSTMISYFANDGSFVSTVVMLGISCVTILFFYDCALRCYGLQKWDVLSFYRIYVYFIFVSCIYNLIINFDALLNLNSLSLYDGRGIRSFFDNKNTFGMLLMFGVLATTILQQLSRKKHWFFISLMFLVNEMMSMCRTAIVISVLLITVSFLADRQKFRKKLLVFLVVSCAVALVVVALPQVHSFVTHSLFGDVVSMEKRNEYVESLLRNIRGMHIWVGHGDVNAMKIADRYTESTYLHNTYVAAYVAGGLVRVAFLLWCMGISLRYSLRLRKLDVREGNLCLVSLMVYAIYSFSEAVMLFDSEMISMTVTAFVVSMPIMLYRCNLASQKSAQKW